MANMYGTSTTEINNGYQIANKHREITEGGGMEGGGDLVMKPKVCKIQILQGMIRPKTYF